MIRRLVLLGIATALAFLPLPPALVERAYSRGVFPPLQSFVTQVSNGVPFALFDILIAAVGLCLLTIVIVAFRRRKSWLGALGGIVWRSALLAAAIYVAFMLLWGLNYRRIPIAAGLERDMERVTLGAVRELARTAVGELNRRYDAAHRDLSIERPAIDPSLADAFARTQPLVGLGSLAVPARPKHTLLDLYFQAGNVAGMTDPFFLETLIASDLLPIERPLVIAHEWSHLAGIADEGEANFVGWLTTVRSSDAARYSGWLFMYGEAMAPLPRREREEIAASLAAGPRDDLRRIAERQRRNVRPAIANASWEAYDRYLKANRVEAGTASYGQVLQLVLSTRFDADWTPRRAASARSNP